MQYVTIDLFNKAYDAIIDNTRDRKINPNKYQIATRLMDHIRENWTIDEIIVYGFDLQVDLNCIIVDDSDLREQILMAYYGLVSSIWAYIGAAPL